MPIQIEVYNQYENMHIDYRSVAEIATSMIKELQISGSSIHFVFVDDTYLKDLHHQYLDDNTVTDVITFNLADSPEVEGEIYISVERAKAHSAIYNVPLEEEITRLAIHGILHLKGYDDQTVDEQKEMREQENYFLTKLPKILIEKKMDS